MDYTPGAEHLDRAMRAELYNNFLCTQGSKPRNPTPVSTRPPTPEPVADVPDRPPDDPYVTSMTAFGIRREYMCRPTYTPKYEHIIRFRTAEIDDATVKRSVADIIKPHDDISQWYFNYGLYCLEGAGTKNRHFTWLQVEQSTDYVPHGLKQARLEQIQHKLENGVGAPWLEGGYAWRLCSVSIEIPAGTLLKEEEHKVWLIEAKQEIKRQTNEDIDLLALDSAPANEPWVGIPFKIPGFYARSIPEVVRHAYEHDANSQYIHHQPYTLWALKDRSLLFTEPPVAQQGAPVERDQPPPIPDIPFNDSDYEQVYGEAYTSVRHQKAHEDVQSLKHQAKHTPDHPNKDCTLEWSVAPAMIWSDATCPYTFSNTKVWPIYLFLGNLTKYLRSKPTARAAHHVGYIPAVWLASPLG
jgi:hypothetical protein